VHEIKLTTAYACKLHA